MLEGIYFVCLNLSYFLFLFDFTEPHFRSCFYVDRNLVFFRQIKGGIIEVWQWGITWCVLAPCFSYKRLRPFIGRSTRLAFIDPKTHNSENHKEEKHARGRIVGTFWACFRFSVLLGAAGALQLCRFYWCECVVILVNRNLTNKFVQLPLHCVDLPPSTSIVAILYIHMVSQWPYWFVSNFLRPPRRWNSVARPFIRCLSGVLKSTSTSTNTSTKEFEQLKSNASIDIKQRKPPLVKLMFIRTEFHLLPPGALKAAPPAEQKINEAK